MFRLPRNPAPWILLSCVLLSGCGTDPPPMVTEVKYIRQQVPAQLLDCAAQPVPPRVASQRDVALYLLDLAEAGEDCRSKLDAVRGVVGAQ